jgi:hypothetical protein
MKQNALHGFQCFEPTSVCVPLIGTRRGMRVFCRCGWSGVAIEREPDENVSPLAETLLQAHVKAA